MKKFILCFLSFLFSYNVFSQQIDNEQLLELMQSQRYAEAAALIQLAYPGEIRDPKIIARLAYCTYMAGNLPQAEMNYKLLLERDSTNKSVLFNLAAINYKRANYVRSVFYYQKILQIDSTNFNVYKQLAALAEKTNDNENCLIYLKKANLLNPTDPDVAYDYANLLKKNEQVTQADSVIQIALEADSLNLLLIKGKIETSYKLKNYKAVIELSQKAIDMGDNSAQTYNLLAQSFYFLKQYQKCIDAYYLLEQQDMGNETTFYYTALSNRRLGNITKSIEYMNKSIRSGISDNVTIYYNELAIDFETLKNYKKVF